MIVKLTAKGKAISLPHYDVEKKDICQKTLANQIHKGKRVLGSGHYIMYTFGGHE